MNFLPFLVFLGLVREIEPLNANNVIKPWPWTPVQSPGFPKPVLYDTGLSYSFKVSVHLGSRSRGPPVAVEFIFSEPSGMQCNMANGNAEFNYTLVLQGKESKYPRHVGPYHGRACDRNFQVDVVDLRKDSDYTAYIVVFNGSTSLKSNQLYFSTTDVQWAHVVKGARHTLITCHFAPGTRARGCRIAAWVMNAQTSAKVKTRYYIIRRLYGVNEASKCIKLNDNLSLGSIEIVDWEENGELGTLRIATAVEESTYIPCYVESPGEMNDTTVLLLVMSIGFIFSGSVLVMISFTMSCKHGRLRLQFKKASCRLCKQDHGTHILPQLPI